MFRTILDTGPRSVRGGATDRVELAFRDAVRLASLDERMKVAAKSMGIAIWPA